MNKEFDKVMERFIERDKNFNRLERMIWGLYVLIFICAFI
tara:strand:+ start:7911 stop:8030 length:120 start_codon:yes stop_codon:yes gene_type:complete